MVIRAALLALAFLLGTSPLLADEEPEKSDEKPELEPAESKPPRPAPAPRLSHAPIAVATAHKPLKVKADIVHPELVKRALLVYRMPTEQFREAEFLRASDGPYVAIVPAEAMRWPSVAYTIELELTDGRRVSVFASRERPYSVQVPEDLMDIRERALYERLGERRSVFAASGEFVSFGSSTAVNPTTGETVSVSDQYYRIEGSYTHRPLRLVTQFGIRAGVLRGKAPVPERELGASQAESQRYSVGLYYISPGVRFRLHDQVHLDGEVLGSITELGFSAGGSGALLLGDPYGSKLTLGFESIYQFGNRFYTRLDVTATDRLIVAPIIEVTNIPSAADYGLRLLGEFLIDVGGGFSVAAQGGYQARVATSGGPSVGGRLSYAF